MTDMAAYLVGREVGDWPAATSPAKDLLFAAVRKDGEILEGVEFEHCTFANVSFKDVVLGQCRFTDCAFLGCLLSQMCNGRGRVHGCKAPRRQGQAKPALPHRDRLPVGEPELLVQDRREGQGLGAALRGRCPGRLRRLAGMPALDSGAARDTVADVDPKPRHVDAPADRCLVLVLDPLGRDRPVTRRAARRQPRIDLVVHLRRDLPAPLRPVLGPRPSGRVAAGAISAGPWRTAPPGASAPAAPWPVPA